MSTKYGLYYLSISFFLGLGIRKGVFLLYSRYALPNLRSSPGSSLSFIQTERRIKKTGKGLSDSVRLFLGIVLDTAVHKRRSLHSP